MKNGGERQRNWKGQSERVVEPVRHRWQVEAGRDSNDPSPVRSFRRTLALLLLLSVCMLSAFVYLLLHAPIKTPIVTVAATNYVWPLPPNGWASEDVSGLASLNGKALHWKDSSKSWQTKSSCLDDLRTQLRELSSLARRAGTIILYINMHGAVNEEGEACFIPPAASSLATAQWITMEELGSTIAANTPPGVKVLLILDCVHQRVHWNTAQLNNTFVNRVESWAALPRSDSIVVLTSSSPDQQSWSSPELHSTIFGRELRLGLAGAADHRSTDSEPANGNGDGAVSVRELADYLISGVDGWTQSHRGTSQTPRVMPPGFVDFRVAWSLKPGELGRQIAAAHHTDVAVSNTTSEDLAELWRGMDFLRDLGAYRYDPKNWAELEHKLLWLEQLSAAGSAYAELTSKQVFPALSRRIKDSLARAKELSNTHNEVAKSRILQEGAETEVTPSHLPSLALQEFLSEVPSSTANTLRASIVGAAVDANQSLAQVVASAGLPPETTLWNELNFVELTKKYECATHWPDRDIIQELFELRDRCERLAIRGDVRSHRWRRPAQLVADRERRQAEDQLILGPVDLLLIGNESQTWSGFRKSLDAIDGDKESIASRIEAAIEIRDQGLSELAYLAAWICSPETEFENLGDWKSTDVEKGQSEAAAQLLNAKPEGIDREQLAIQELKRWISGLQELGELLSNVSEPGTGKKEQLNEVFGQVHRDSDSLKALVRDHVDRALRTSAANGVTIRQVESLMALPFLSAYDRVSLRKKLEQLIRDSVLLSQRTQIEDSESGVSAVTKRLGLGKRSTKLESARTESPEIQRVRYAERMRIWASHPLGEILQLKDGLSIEASAGLANPRVSDSERELVAIDVANSRLRRCYQSMLSFNAFRLEDWGQSSGIKQTIAPESDDWTKTAFAEQYERAIIPLCPIRFESNSALSFRRLALKDLLLWFARRTIDDFYADGKSEGFFGTSSETYFERAVQRVLNYASSIQESTASMSESAQSIGEQVQILGPIARNGIIASVKRGSPVAESDRIPFEVNVQPTVATLSTELPWKLPIPDGLATILVRNPRGILREGRIGISMPVTGQTPSYNLVCPPLDQSLTHEVVVVYRGHEFPAPMFVRQGIVVDFKPSQYDWADLVLFGDRQRQPSTVFVLDCSWSMGEEIPMEAIALRSQSRLDLAKESVLRMLTQIASRPDARVGVRLFGHRLGWSRPIDEKTGATKGKSQILVQPNYPDAIPNDLVPSRDVEAILPLGRFSTDMIGGLSSKLTKIVPWGQSPLYLSIIESFRDFSADDDSTAKSIVIITDGDNFQFNASGRPGGEPGSTTTLDGVYRAWSTNKVPLFILGVGVSDRENANSRKTLQELAERTKGKYYDIENGSDLLRALSEQLSLGTYRVTKSDGVQNGKNADSFAEAKLNTPIELTKISQAPYDVSFQSIIKSIQLRGGESVELFLTDDARDIVSKPYDRSSPRSATLVRTGDSGRMIARVHRPSQHKNGVNFPISIQDPDSHFTPRPNQLWIEVTPVVANAKLPRQTYYFFDTHYEAKTPVPLVNWHASNWPGAATAADVRVWAKYEPTPNLQSIPLVQVLQNSQRYSDGVEVSGVEGVRLSIRVLENRAKPESVEIHVTEMHNDRSSGIGSIRVNLETEESNMPSRIIRRFETESKMAIHTFEFDASVGARMLRSPASRLTIQSRAASHEGAWQLQAGQPIRVDVTSIPETLPQIGFPTSGKPQRR